MIQSCRGTGGSGGTYEPFRQERADGRATVAWPREQPWFTGAMAMIGPSYLSSVQWALAADPPPALRAMVTQVSVSDPYALVHPWGVFALENVLVAAAATLGFERGMAAVIRTGLRVRRHMRRVARRLPLIDAYPAALGTRLGWVDEYLASPDRGDPYWASLDIGEDHPGSHLRPHFDLFARLCDVDPRGVPVTWVTALSGAMPRRARPRRARPRRARPRRARLRRTARARAPQ